MTDTRPIHIDFPIQGTLYDPRPCMIRAWRAGETSHVRFYGPPYTLWTEADGHAPGGLEAQRIHDALEGWHACILHADDVAVILPHHPDFERVSQILDEAENF